MRSDSDPAAQDIEAASRQQVQIQVHNALKGSVEWVVDKKKIHFICKFPFEQLHGLQQQSAAAEAEVEKVGIVFKGSTFGFI